MKTPKIKKPCTVSPPGEYSALLDAHEETATLDCGCVLSRPFEGTAANTFCPLHAHAGDLLAALKEILSHKGDDYNNFSWAKANRAHDDAQGGAR